MKTVQVVLVALLCLVTTSCVIVGRARIAEPNVAPELRDGSHIKVELQDYTAKLYLDWPIGGVALMGIGVPIIPFGQWKWLTGISDDELRFAVIANLLPKNNLGQFKPDTLRLRIKEKEYVPSAVEIIPNQYAFRATRAVASGETITVTEPLYVRFKFQTVSLPDVPFQVIAEGWPVIDYVAERKFYLVGGIPKQ